MLKYDVINLEITYACLKIILIWIMHVVELLDSFMYNYSIIK